MRLFSAVQNVINPGEAARWLQTVATNPQTAAFVKSLDYNALPANWGDRPEIVNLAERVWQAAGEESPFFRAYFQGSKVVDAAGKPLTVHHGTNVDNIDVFRKSKIGNLGPAIYFTPNRDEAVKYAAARNGGVGGTVYDVFVKSQKPWKISGSNASPEEFWAKIPGDTEADVIKNLKKKGYDSVWAGNDEIAIYDPRQIKSILNRGTFNPFDPNMYRSVGPIAAGGSALGAAALAASEGQAAPWTPPDEPGLESSFFDDPIVNAIIAPVGASAGILTKLGAIVTDAIANGMFSAAEGIDPAAYAIPDAYYDVY